MSKAFEQKKLGEATPAEVRAYAGSFLGIPTDGETDAKILAKVRAAIEGDTIFVANEPENTVMIGTPPPKPLEGEIMSDRGALEGGLGKGDPKVRITVHADEREGTVNSFPLEVGVNGVVWLIKRGESVEVPYRVYEALRNATRTTIRHDRAGNEIVREVQTVAFNVESMPPQGEVDAWQRRVSNQFVPA